MDFKREFFTSGVHIHHSRSERPNECRFEKHCHSDYEILYVVEGEGKYMVEGEELPLQGGTAILMHPCQYHYVSIDPGCCYERYAVHFDAEMLPAAVGGIGLLCGEERGGRSYFSSLSNEGALRGALDAFFAVAESCSEGESDLISASVGAAVTQSVLLLSRESSDEVEDGEGEQITAILEYINRNIVEELSLETLSREFFVSKYHLCRLFRRHMGVTLFEYVAAKRFALAEGYLDSGLPATEVSERVGYRDYSSFYRAYVKRAGHPPVRFRHEKQ